MNDILKRYRKFHVVNLLNKTKRKDEEMMTSVWESHLTTSKILSKNNMKYTYFDFLDVCSSKVRYVYKLLEGIQHDIIDVGVFHTNIEDENPKYQLNKLEYLELIALIV